MNINWLQYSLALLLLWTPRQWLRVGVLFKLKSSRSRSADSAAVEREPGDLSVRFRDEFKKFRNYVDFLRAAIGGVAIMGGIAGLKPSLQLAADSAEWFGRLVIAAQFAVLLIGVLLQSFRFEKRATMYPPIFYLSGLSFGLIGWGPAIFALVLIWAFNTTLPGPTAFLFIYAVLAGLFGWLLASDITQVVFAVVLIFAPVLISLLTKRRLVHFVKKTKAAG